MTDAAALEYNPPGKAAGCVILLHGLGADGGDLFPLAAQLGGGNLRVVCPHAPVRPVTLNNGWKMRAWYDIAGVDLSDRQDRPGADASAQEMEKLLAAEKANGFAAGQIYLAGFSQGAAMALHVGLRHGEPLAGVIALSGYLLFADALAAEGKNRDTPIFQAHGGVDMVVLPQWGRMTRDILTENGYAVEYREYPMLSHEISNQELEDLNHWLTARG